MNAVSKVQTNEPQPNKLQWYEPKWSYQPALERSLQRTINVRSASNIAIASTIVGAILLIAMKLWIPNFVIPNLMPAVLSWPALMLMLYFQTKLLLVISPTITLKPKFLLRSHGQTGLKIMADKFRSAKLYFHSGKRVRLWVRYQGIQRERILKVGLPCDTDFDLLVRLLPVPTKVVDARNRMSTQSEKLDMECQSSPIAIERDSQSAWQHI